MPLVYGIAPGVVQTTSGTPNTETCPLFAVGDDVLRGLEYILGLYVHGRGAGLTAISGLSFRIKRGGGGSEGAPITPSPRAPGSTANTNARYSTNGVTVTTSVQLSLSIGCGAAGASGWFASSIDQCPALDGLSASWSLVAASGLASMNYEYSLEVMH